MMSQTDRLHFLISYMQQENKTEQSVPDDFDERFEVFRGLANERLRSKSAVNFSMCRMHFYLNIILTV
nr:hypothetical protein [Jeotgalicoccus sp. WY2]